MDASDISTGWNIVYSLWHIPSSALLVTTLLQDEVIRRVRSVLGAGVPMDDLMLQVTSNDELIGHQHLGTSIAQALHLDERGADTA